MEELDKLVESAFNSYFNTLSKLGTSSISKTKNILVLSFLDEILYSDINWFITKDDYESIMQVINNLSGNNCTIPFMSYQTFDSIMHEYNKKHTTIRVNESGSTAGHNAIRMTEIDNIRLTEKVETE